MKALKQMDIREGLWRLFKIEMYAKSMLFYALNILRCFNLHDSHNTIE